MRGYYQSTIRHYYAVAKYTLCDVMSIAQIESALHYIYELILVTDTFLFVVLIILLYLSFITVSSSCGFVGCTITAAGLCSYFVWLACADLFLRVRCLLAGCAAVGC